MVSCNTNEASTIKCHQWPILFSELLGIFPLSKKMTVDCQCPIEAPHIENHKKAAMLSILLDHMAGPQ